MSSGNVLVEELVLEVDGVGGDHHALVIVQGPVNGGHEVGHRLARAGPGLDHHVLAAVEGLGHGAQHLDLLGAMLVTGHAAGQRAVLVQHGGDLIQVQQGGGLIGPQRTPGSGGRAEGFRLCEGIAASLRLRFVEGGADALRQGGLESRTRVPFRQRPGRVDDLLQRAQRQRQHALPQRPVEQGGGGGVGQGAVGIFQGDGELLSQAVEIVARRGRQHGRGQLVGI